ncbi:MAG: DUF4139 domain-containing protein [Kiritimatiellae bacterium]|nr:DUF4139 domain-containing protein [Kiritimatiellia bacterium]
MSEEGTRQFAVDATVAEGERNRIDEVVLFTDQVYVKRRAELEAKAGLNRFFVEVKAFAVDADSAQAAVRGEGEILSVQYRQLPVKDAPQEDVRALTDRKRELARRRRALEDQKSVLLKKTQFLDSLVNFAESELPRKVKTDFPKAADLDGTLKFLDANYREQSDAIRALDHQLEDLDRDIQVLERQLKQRRQPQEETRKGIEIVFRSAGDQTLLAEPTYVARHATWEPVYRVDVPEDLTSVAMSLFARIRQKTGEDWAGVKLAVSNAVPVKGVALPDLQSWRVDIGRRPVPMAKAAFRGAVALEEAAVLSDVDEALELAAPPAAMAAAAAPEPPQAAFTQAVGKELPLTFEYELPQRLRVDSGEDESILPMYTKELPGEFFDFAVPKQDPLTYLVCRAAPDQELLAGTLNVYFAGRFVGATTLAPTKAGEAFRLNLGADRAVKVRREKVTDKAAETFFGKVERHTVARELAFKIVVENVRKKPVRVCLLDAIPVSKTDRVQIKGVELDPPPGTKDYESREGVMLWDLQLEAGQTREIGIRFHVKHPRDNPPWGLD